MTKAALNRAQRRKLEKQNKKRKPASKSHLQLLPTTDKDNSMNQVMHNHSMNQKQPSKEEMQQANLEQRYAQNQQYLHNIKAKYVDSFSNTFRIVAINMFNSGNHSNKTEEQILEGAKAFTDRLKEATIAYGNLLMEECPVPIELAESNKAIEKELDAIKKPEKPPTTSVAKEEAVKGETQSPPGKERK